MPQINAARDAQLERTIRREGTLRSSPRDFGGSEFRPVDRRRIRSLPVSLRLNDGSQRSSGDADWDRRRGHGGVGLRRRVDDAVGTTSCSSTRVVDRAGACRRAASRHPQAKPVSIMERNTSPSATPRLDSGSTAWIAQGVAAPWPSAGSDAFVGVPAMNSPVRQMAEGQSVRWTALVTRIEEYGRGWRLVLDQAKPSKWISPSSRRLPSRRRLCSHRLRRISQRVRGRRRARRAGQRCWPFRNPSRSPRIAGEARAPSGGRPATTPSRDASARRVGSCKPARSGRGSSSRRTRIGSPTR